MTNKSHLDIEREQYLNKWGKNSSSFKEQKLYEWMVSKVKRFSPKSIFDIGCGDGNALICLIEHLHNRRVKIISIDENIECLKAAKRNIEEAGITVELIERLNTNYINSKLYSLEHSKIDGSFDKQITLIESDFLIDEYLSSFLKDYGKFDLVTIWLIGTHSDRDNCENLSCLNEDVAPSKNYRLKVQNGVYELSDAILRKNGILQVVDRNELPRDKLLKDEIIKLHNAQASVTSLKVTGLDYIPYKEPDNGIEMEISSKLSGRIPEKFKLAITSVISVRS